MLDTTTLVIFASVQFGLALLAGAMALGRNRDGAIWFLIGAAFGPLAVVALLFFGTPPQRT